MSREHSRPTAFEDLLLRTTLRRDDTHSAYAGLTWPERISTMQTLERYAIARAALAGILSGVVAALGVRFAAPLWVENPSGVAPQLPYYGLTLGISGLATVIEIGFLFWDGVRTAVRVGAVAGSLDGEATSQVEDVASMHLSLARAGIETPPPRTPWRGIDPLAESSRLRILLFALLYKAKVAGTSAVVKGLFRRAAGRVAGRALARSVVELAAAPVFAVWNAVVCRRIMRDIRFRALGPHLAQRVLERTFPGTLRAERPEVQQAALFALRWSIVSAGRRHPNLVLIGHEMFSSATVSLPPRADRELEAALMAFDERNRARMFEFMLQLLALTGRVSWSERRTLSRIAVQLGESACEARLRAHGRSMLDGSLLEAPH